ncbi:MAG: efflux RND transporter periplasmic adaptor subunit [Vicinamibacterales bacterium]
MKRSTTVVALIATLAIGGGAYYFFSDASSTDAAGPPAAGARGGFAGGFGAGRGGAGQPMTVEIATVTRADLSQQITVVGNLIGAATVTTVPKISGRLETVAVRMGDQVRRGQRLAKIEDRELLEQVKQAEASFAVSAATIRQREADLRFAQTNLDRSQNLFERQLIPKQTMDDAEARYQAAAAQLDLARAQYQQTQARLDELKINLDNTVIVSPVDGFVGSRTLDPGAWVTPNSEFLSMVDIRVVRIVSNVVERDLRRIASGQPATVEVDAYPGETFNGRVAHIAPVLDPTTRTAQVEIEIDNPEYRLKPGMYARVSFTVDVRPNVLVIPTSALVEAVGSRGVFLADESNKAVFQPITVGLVEEKLTEVSSGLQEGQPIITTGAAALRNGDVVAIAGQAPPGPAGERVDVDGEDGGRGRARTVPATPPGSSRGNVGS